MARETSSQVGIGSSISLKARILCDTGYALQSLDLLDEAIEIFETIDHHRGLACVLFHKAIALQLIKQDQKALQCAASGVHPIIGGV